MALVEVVELYYHIDVTIVAVFGLILFCFVFFMFVSSFLSNVVCGLV